MCNFNQRCCSSSICGRGERLSLSPLFPEKIKIKMASASASLIKTSPVLDKSEFVKGQALRQPSVSSVVLRCRSVAPSALTVRASYADELVKTAVSFFFKFVCILFTVFFFFFLFPLV